MARLATVAVEQAPAVASAAPPIDRRHLAHMTLGDSKLEREVLQLFDRQATLLLARMRQVEPAAMATLAHTLKGSARGVGAWDVARAAGAVELADGVAAERETAMNRLVSAVDAARAIIAELLRAH